MNAKKESSIFNVEGFCMVLIVLEVESVDISNGFFISSSSISQIFMEVSIKHVF